MFLKKNTKRIISQDKSEDPEEVRENETDPFPNFHRAGIFLNFYPRNINLF